MAVPTVVDMSGVLAAISEFRDLVNQPRLQQVLMKDLPRWGKLCSAMDVIEDTGMAIRSYSSGEDIRDKGKLYLETYGVLQALVVQQDAVLDLCGALGSSRAKGDFSWIDQCAKGTCFCRWSSYQETARRGRSLSLGSDEPRSEQL
jgi:hypothetical protein